jgi:hypothetical protein
MNAAERRAYNDPHRDPPLRWIDLQCSIPATAESPQIVTCARHGHREVWTLVTDLIGWRTSPVYVAPRERG